MTPSIRFDADPRRTEAFELRWGRIAETGERVLRKTARTAEAQRLVHAEVNAGNLLAARPGGYPVQLGRVVEHDLAGEHPHVTTTWRGQPVAGQPGVPLPQTVLTVFEDLLTAIEALAKAGLAHGAILPEHVLWDGEHAQLVNLGAAAAVGEPVRAAPDPAWRPPPGRDGLRLAGEAHAVYQAGMVLYCMAARTAPVDAATARAALGAGGGSPLGELLDGVFADDEAERPGVHTLLRRVEQARATPVWQDPEHPDEADETTATILIPRQAAPTVAGMAAVQLLSPARREFRQLSAAKREYRAARAQPAAVTWRYARELFDVLWYSRDDRSSQVLLGLGALLLVGVPLLIIVLIVRGTAG